jgi:hypothetical protein
MKLTASFGVKFGPPLRPEKARPSTVKSTTISSPAFVPGLSDGAAAASPTWLSGKVAA